uniref:Putative ribbon-helix-helix protein repressor n=1 Tax=viral metagenome TaxID=1070528 RepID=A0A6H1ZZE3_9ZZZZ
MTRHHKPKRSNSVGFYCGDSELAVITELAEQQGLTKSAAIREACAWRLKRLREEQRLMQAVEETLGE